MKQRKTPSFFATEVSEARRFYINLTATTGGPLRVVTGGFEHCGANYCVDRLSFPFPIIEYVVRGQGELRLTNNHYTLRPGSIFAYDKGMPHRITCGPRSQLMKYFIAFTGGNTAKFLDSCGLTAGELAHVSPADALTALFEELIWAGMRGAPDSPIYCRRIMECLAVRIHASIAAGAGTLPASFVKYQACRNYIERNFLNLHNGQDIARHCAISEVHLCHLFRRYDHQTPYRLLTRLKMNHAAALIQQSTILVRDAAKAVGYGDPFHFSRVFRNIFGVAPSTWRLVNVQPTTEE